MSPPDVQTIARRVRERRQGFAATVEQAARWADLSPQRWQEIESGGSSMLVSELGRVAEALAVDWGVLVRGEADNPRRSLARFRSASPALDLTPDDLRLLALAAELGRFAGGLYGLLSRSLPLLDARRPSPVDAREEPWRQGYRLGSLARQALRLGTGPIANLETSLSELGIHIARVQLSDPRLEAASLWEPGAVPMVLLNTRSPRIGSSLPRRAALAHEVCHLLHDSGESDLTTQLSWEQGQGPARDAIEQRARGFAPALLAPPDEVKHWLRTRRGGPLGSPEKKVSAIARQWGLSYEGAIWHAKNCQLIRARTADELRKQSPPGGHQDWDRSFETEPPAKTLADDTLQPVPLTNGSIAALTWQALEEGVITRGRAREILRWGG